uniref:Uncharacterized protein n=1 Tax=Zosterops lateralis melanops TaxID=1220523 RepID=A0A8D2PUA7_ZOSLA
MNFFGFPSFSVGPCMIIHFPETAGKNTMPAARSYSSRCSQTCSLIGNCSGPMSFSRAEALVPYTKTNKQTKSQNPNKTKTIKKKEII